MFDEALGSDYDFSRYTFDIRGYREILESHVLAARCYINIMRGGPPFNMLSLLGQIGQYNLMRGYYQGRSRDRDILVFQSEYRARVWWRFGIAAFAGVGDVASKADRFNLEDFKFSYGGGLRFLLNEKEKINIRFDVGFGREMSGFYFTIGEAF